MGPEQRIYCSALIKFWIIPQATVSLFKSRHTLFEYYCTHSTGHQCFVTDDPLTKTFDCVHYEYHGKCSYTLIKPCGNTSIPLHIVGDFERLRYHPKMAVMKRVEIHVEDDVSLCVFFDFYTIQSVNNNY